mmetsp:Transcript_17552/g.51370  ORF Transcript_17552/g.51370 Transcript_17552/m.51370 type:complete len:342 (-) Transcript_17552:79-1104(-)
MPGRVGCRVVGRPLRRWLSGKASEGVRDVVVIGSGPAGYTAALYTARALLKPLVLAGYAHGGQLMLTSDVENFPGYSEPIGGPEMMADLRRQAERFGAEVVEKDVAAVDLSAYPFHVSYGFEETVAARAVIITTGARAIWLDALGEDQVRGRGVSTCATCDGAFFKDQSVVVVGGGDSAMEEALFLTRFASKVTLLHRHDNFKASRLMLERALSHPRIEVRPFRRVARWLSRQPSGALSPELTGAMLEDPRTGDLEEIPCTGAFIAIGHQPITDLFRGQLDLDNEGYVVHQEHTMTSTPGVFAAGDVVDTRYRQAITAAGMGCQAAIDAERWLTENPPHRE